MRRARGRALAAALVATLAVSAASVRAEPYAVGSTLPALTIEDQHGTAHRLDDGVRAVLFGRDMDGGDLIKEVLADDGAALLARHRAVHVADISGMPRLITRLFALPRMRERPYPILLDRDGELTKQFPGAKGKATVLVLERRRLTAVHHVDSADALRAALAELPAD